MQLSKLARLRGDVTRLVGISALRSAKLRAWVGRSRKTPLDGSTVDEFLAAMLGLDDLIGASDFSKEAPQSARAKLAESILSVEEKIRDPLQVEDLYFKGEAGVIKARSYSPPGLQSATKAVFFMHGGGFVLGDLDTHDSLCRRIALDTGARVFAIDYRLAPEARFPAAAEDAVAAFRDMGERANELGIDTKKIAVLGDSAGGNLSAVVSLRTRADAIRPALQALIYPAVDATCAEPSHKTLAEGYMLNKAMLDWYYGHYFGGNDALRRHPDASPLFAETLVGVPPALVYTAGFDPLRDEGALYAKRLREAGVATEHVCFESQIHGFTLMGGLIPAAKEATAKICRDVGAALDRGSLT